MLNLLRSHPTHIFVLKSIIATVLLFSLIHYIKVEVIISSLSLMNLSNLIVFLLLSFVMFSVFFVRWKYLLSMVDTTIHNKEIIASLFIGRAFGFFTPFQFGDFVGRVMTHRTVPRSHVVGMIVIEKSYTIITSFLIGMTGTAYFVSQYYTQYWHTAYTLIVLFLAVILIGLALTPQTLKRSLILLPQKIKEHRLFKAVDIIGNSLDPKKSAVIFLLTIISYGISFFQYFIFINAFEHITLWHTVLGTACIIFVNNFLLPIAIGDIGVRESAAMFFLGFFGISAATAFNVFFLTFFANAIIPGIIGVIFILKNNVQLQSLSKESEKHV